jgi:aminopeptidase N
MLENYLGAGTFATGIRAYIRQHAYSNTTAADLWNALAAASGKPVAAIASAYTEQAGVPLVVVQAYCASNMQHVRLRQERFTIHDPDAKPRHWQVPVVLGTVRTRTGAKLLLDGSAEVAAGLCGEPVKLNLGDGGYYRVQYDDAMAAALARSIGEMLPADRVNLLADTWALVEAGRAVPATYFALVDRLSGDDSHLVWDQVIRSFSRIDHLERGRAGRGAFHAYARAVLRPVFDRLGFDAAAGEPQDRGILRSRLIGMLGEFGDEAILAEAKRRFAAFLTEPASLSVDLRATVTILVGRAADRATTTRCSRSAETPRTPPSACAIITRSQVRSIRRSRMRRWRSRSPTSCLRPLSTGSSRASPRWASIPTSPGPSCRRILRRWRRSRGRSSETPSPRT